MKYPTEEWLAQIFLEHNREETRKRNNMKCYTIKSIENLVSNINIDGLCTLLKIPTVDNGEDIYKCPFCNTGEMVFNEEEEPTRFFCFDCEKKGNAIDIVMEVRDKTYEEAVEILSLMYNLPVEGYTKEELEIEKTCRKTKGLGDFNELDIIEESITQLFLEHIEQKEKIDRLYEILQSI